MVAGIVWTQDGISKGFNCQLNLAAGFNSQESEIYPVKLFLTHRQSWWKNEVKACYCYYYF